MSQPQLQLTEWRREVASLYAAVRKSADPAEGHATWRAGRDALFRDHPQTPLLPDDPLRESGLPYWPYDPALRFVCALEAGEPRNAMSRPRRTDDRHAPDRARPVARPGRREPGRVVAGPVRRRAVPADARRDRGHDRPTAAAGTSSTPPRAPTWAARNRDRGRPELRLSPVLPVQPALGMPTAPQRATASKRMIEAGERLSRLTRPRPTGRRTPRAAAPGSSASVIARTTTARRAPRAITSSSRSSVSIPPIANHGRSSCVRGRVLDQLRARRPAGPAWSASSRSGRSSSTPTPASSRAASACAGECVDRPMSTSSPTISPGDRHRQVVLAEMQDRRADRPGDVGPVVDREQRAVPLGRRGERPRAARSRRAPPAPSRATARRRRRCASTASRNSSRSPCRARESVHRYSRASSSRARRERRVGAAREPAAAG